MARGQAQALLPPLLAGHRVVRQLDAEWRGLNASIACILEDE
jgi:hypothetical protein